MKKSKDNTTPFDRHRIPPKQNVFLTPFIWGICWILTRKQRLRIKKIGMKGLKPPYLVLGNHLAFMDFLVTPLTLFPRRANYVSELEGFEAYGETLYRQIGCLGTRKFIYDIALIKNIKRVMERRGILVLYPEARYANVGTSSELPDSVAKLVKWLKVPVVVLRMKGNYLQSPIWNLHKRPGVRLEATLEKVFDAKAIQELSPEEISDCLGKKLRHDEYAWQYEHGMKINYDKRAEGLEAVLYLCPICKAEFQMAAMNAELVCQQCQSRWELTELGQINVMGDVKGKGYTERKSFTHIPDWYEWQRQEVISEIDLGDYRLEQEVLVEALPNAKKFIPLGKGILSHNRSGFSLLYYDESQEKQDLFFPSQGMTSIHTEYDYRGKGPCVVLSTLDNSYFLFSRDLKFNVTKIQFATEYFYNLSKGEKKPEAESQL